MIKIISAIVFLSLLLIGFRIAEQKAVWNDEIYSQIARKGNGNGDTHSNPN